MLTIYGSLLRLWQKRARRIQLTSAVGSAQLCWLLRPAIRWRWAPTCRRGCRWRAMRKCWQRCHRELHGECARQIARRISIRSGCCRNDLSTVMVATSHGARRPARSRCSSITLQGLRALCLQSPLIKSVSTPLIPTSILASIATRGSTRSTRFNSALASANQALANGRVIELFEAQPIWPRRHGSFRSMRASRKVCATAKSGWPTSPQVGSSRAIQALCGAEALIRWNHPTRGPIAPDAFILQAERAGRIDSADILGA